MQGGAAYDYCHNVFSKLMAFDTMYICNGQLCITRYYFIQISMIFIVLGLIQRACRFPIIIDNSRIIISVGHFECILTNTYNFIAFHSIFWNFKNSITTNTSWLKWFHHPN